MDSKYYPKIQKIADTYGYDAQSRQCIEEMAELTQAINKAWKKRYDDFEERTKAFENIREEICDVEIMLEQIKYLLQISDTDINEIIEQKLDRQLERIEKCTSS